MGKRIHLGRRRCSQRNPAGGIARKAIRYGTSTARWIAAARPTRSPTEVERLFVTFCKPCPKIDEEGKRCRLCGCALRKKLHRATDHCPLKSPKW